jgi:hypothetical protein
MIQVHGFTCGVDDLLLMKEKDDERRKNLLDCAKVGEVVHLEFVNDMGGVKIGMLLFMWKSSSSEFLVSSANVIMV